MVVFAKQAKALFSGGKIGIEKGVRMNKAIKISAEQKSILEPHFSAARQIEQSLRDQIISFELPPGIRLSEQEIAKKFSVSRQPVREALIALAKAELVSIVPQRGTTVVKISSDRMYQARFIREQIEVGVARQAAEKGLNASAEKELGNFIHGQSKALRLDDIKTFKILDEAFHECLARSAGLEIAWRTIGDIKSHIDRACYLTLTDGPSMYPLIGQHQAILDAIINRNVKEAEKAMRHHLTDILRALPITITNNIDYFE
jgi:GntR family transcriptional regulator, rspAB operon transcriptional repressor